MKKNVASQKIGAQMVSATDGSAFTGAVTVYVTGDAGTQAAGSVGSGACTHEGNGYHTYAPAQAETNYDIIAFTFTGTGAVPATVQVFTAFPQTGDSFGLIGATGSGLTSLATQASVNTIDDFLDTEIAAIKAKTDNLPTDPADQSAVEAAITAATSPLATAAALATVDTVVDSILVDTAEIGVAGAGLTALASAADLATVAGYIDTEVAAILAAVDTEVGAIKTKTDQLTFTVANQVDSNALSGGGGLDAAGVRAAVGLAAANLDTQLTAIDDFLDTEVAAIKAKTDNLPAAPAATGDIPSAATIADAVWDEALAGHVGAGSAGAAAGNLDAAVSTRLATAGYTAPDNATIAAILLDTAEIGAAGAGLTALATQASVNTIDDFLDTEIAAIKAQTDLIPAAPAAVGDIPTADITAILADTNDIQTRLPAALVGGRMDSNLSAIGNDTTALTAFKRAVLGNIIGTVGAASTTTSIVTSSMTPAAAVTDQFLGRIVVFDKDTTTANLRGQATDITASTAGGVLTVTALTTAPVSGDTFTIL